MHFSKILPVTLFAALAVATPTPQGVSVPSEQIKQFSESLQSFASTTEREFNEVKGQKGSLHVAWHTEQDRVVGQGFDELTKYVNKVNIAASKLASTLEIWSMDYDEEGQASSFSFD